VVDAKEIAVETLHERFADLVEEAPTSPTPAGIWSDGRHRARRRRVGTAVVAAVTLLALAGVGGLAAHRAAAPGYAGADSTPALPNRIYHPSPWLGGTGDQPPGRLSMLIPGKRGGWPHYHWGMVGVSATTGVYRYLDIPGCVSVDGISPDGLHVSCFTGSGSGSGSGRSGQVVVDGLAIYDTVTGHVDRWSSPSGRLALNTVTWASNDAVAFRAGDTSYVWELGQGEPRAVPTRLTLRASAAGSTGLYQSGPHGYFYLDPTHRPVRIHLGNVDRRTLAGAALSRSRRRLAVTQPTDTGTRLLVGYRGPGRSVTRLLPVDAALMRPRIVGWADEHHLLVVNQVSPAGRDGSAPRYALDRVDVDTGQMELVASMSDQQTSWGALFASSLLGAPTRDFPAPPHPINQRLELGLVVGLLCLGGVGLVVWRRRVRP
jgi:hypothetical protein